MTCFRATAARGLDVLALDLNADQDTTLHT